jgi:hypothetical protein
MVLGVNLKRGRTLKAHLKHEAQQSFANRYVRTLDERGGEHQCYCGRYAHRLRLVLSSATSTYYFFSIEGPLNRIYQHLLVFVFRSLAQRFNMIC